VEITGGNYGVKLRERIAGKGTAGGKLGGELLGGSKASSCFSAFVIKLRGTFETCAPSFRAG
jgi:hypothetical protein